MHPTLVLPLLLTTLASALPPIPPKVTLAGTLYSSAGFRGNTTQIFDTTVDARIFNAGMALDPYASIKIFEAVNCTISTNNYAVRLEGPIQASRFPTGAAETGKEDRQVWEYICAPDVDGMTVDDAVGVTIRKGAWAGASEVVAG